MYAYIVWNPDWETGYSLIDNQHKRWVATVNDLFDAYRQGKGYREVKQAMRFVGEYATRHFNDEEEFLMEHAYPDYREHSKIHNDFKGIARKMANELHREGPSDEFIDYVCVTMGRWVINHIKKEDFKWVEYIRNKDQDAPAGETS